MTKQPQTIGPIDYKGKTWTDKTYISDYMKQYDDLLEACKEAVIHLGGCCSHNTTEECDAVVRKLLINAISKAEGR